MAYTFTKLSDVELVESVAEPNLLIEDGGEIKKIPASNVASKSVQPDWNETDETSQAYILNKPESFSPEIVSYDESFGRYIYDASNNTWVRDNNTPASMASLVSDFKNGLDVRCKAADDLSSSKFIAVCYCGSWDYRAYYINSSGQLVSLYGYA